MWVGMNDGLVQVIACTYQLLAGNPEQEQLLLERLVNKLGDPVRGVAAKAMYHLTLLLGKKTPPVCPPCL